jgi:hypothetical protein
MTILLTDEQFAAVRECLESIDNQWFADVLAILDAAPTQSAVPLTVEQIKEMSEEIWGAELDYKHLAEIKFARAIEAAHGIAAPQPKTGE